MVGERTSPGGGELGEQEVESRLASIKVGIWLSVVVCLGSALYAVHEWHRPNRVLILAAIALGLLTAPLVRALPLERIVRSRHSELFFVAWSVADILLIATIAGLDGGSQSPYMLLLILPFLFAAMSYPPRTIAAVGIADLVAFFGVAFGVGGGLPLSRVRPVRRCLHRAARRLGGAQSVPAAGGAHRDRRCAIAERGDEPQAGPPAA